MTLCATAIVQNPSRTSHSYPSWRIPWCYRRAVTCMHVVSKSDTEEGSNECDTDTNLAPGMTLGRIEPSPCRMRAAKT